MLKKICSVVLALCMSMGGLTALAYEDVTTERQSTAVELMTGFGVMEPESDTVFGNKTLVKRGEFALYVTRLIGHNIVTHSVPDGYFDDVDTTTLEGAAVDFFASIGIIPKNKREYNPNDEITYSEAVRILLNCLGYDEVAAANGGFPGGYIKTATECGINKNLWLMTNSVLTKTDAATLMYNALFVQPIIRSSNRTFIKSEKTLMENVWDVDSVTGVVTGYENTVIGGGKTLPDGCVEIGGVVYRAGNTNIKDYIGYTVRAYYSAEDDVNTIVSFTEKSNTNTAVTLDIDDIDISGNQITYRTDGRKKTQKVSESAAVIYNGRYYTNYSNITDLIDGISEGEVKFISNDSSSSANVVIINSYKHLLVERVDKRNKRLYLKNGSASEASVPYLKDVVSLSDDDVDSLEVYMDGQSVEFDEIQSDDAITMIESPDGKDVSLYISRDAVEGIINSVSEDEITISDTDYTISKYSTLNYTSGTNGVYAITTDGKVLGLVGAKKSVDSNYAYVIDVYTEDGREKAYVELYTAAGELLKLECSKDMKVNSKKRTYKEMPNLGLKSQLVTYKKSSDDLLLWLNLPYDASSRMTYVNETEFIKNWNKSSVRYTDGIMGMSCITEDTLIFSMPRFDRGNESDYRMLQMSDLENRTYADVTCYDVDRQGRVGALLIVEDSSDSVSMGDSLFFVKKKLKSVDDNDEPVVILEGYQDGELKEISFTVDTDSVTYEDGWMNRDGNENFDPYENYANYGDSLSAGDAIQYNLDNEGNVGAYRKIFNNRLTAYDDEGKPVGEDMVSANYYEDWSGTGSVTKQDFYDDLYIAYGDVQLRYMDYMLFLGLNEKDRKSYESGSNPIQIIDYYRPINLLNANVYTYNIYTGKLELGDMEDVQKGDSVFVRSKRMGQLNEVMVYIKD